MCLSGDKIYLYMSTWIRGVHMWTRNLVHVYCYDMCLSGDKIYLYMSSWIRGVHMWTETWYVFIDMICSIGTVSCGSFWNHTPVAQLLLTDFTKVAGPTDMTSKKTESFLPLAEVTWPNATMKSNIIYGWSSWFVVRPAVYARNCLSKCPFKVPDFR